MGQVGALLKKTMIGILSVFFLTVIFPALPVHAQVPAKVRVGIVTANSGSNYKNASIVTFSVKGQYQLEDLSAIPGENLIGTPVEGESWQIYYLTSGLQVYQNGNPLKITAGPIVVKEKAHSAGNYVSLDSYTVNGTTNKISKRYRGNMEFLNNGTSVSAINELPFEEYLYGVVPSEMSDSWPLEALKAQALAARSYTVYHYNKRIAEGFNMLDTQTDQVYNGLNKEGPNSTKAVSETAGQVILYGGKVIDAVFHSNSGGHTEDNENVWGGTPIPYLRGIDDPYTVRDLANWTYTTTIDDVRNKLIQSGSSIGAISTIQLEKFKSGRVKSVIITDVNGNTITKSGKTFGQLFNPGFYKYINNTSFMSNFFDVKMDQVSAPIFTVLSGTGQKVNVPGTGLYAVTDDGTVSAVNGEAPNFYVIGAQGTSSYGRAASGTVVFEGHGWGHGVGMSQWGAYEMASQGKSCEEIIKFYYTGVEIE